MEIITEPADAYIEDFIRDVNRSRVLSAGVAMDPVTSMSLDTDPRSAQSALENDRQRVGFVTDGDNQYRGMVLLRDVSAAVRRGDHDLGDVVRDETPTARAEQSLEELLGVAADNRLPIPVLSEEERLLGVLTPRATLSALAGDRAEEGSADGRAGTESDERHGSARPRRDEEDDESRRAEGDRGRPSSG